MNSALLSAGIVCLMAAMIGGGLEAFGIKVPVLKSIKRQVFLGLLGVLLIGLWLYLSVIRSEGQDRTVTQSTQQTIAQKQSDQSSAKNQSESTQSRQNELGLANNPGVPPSDDQLGSALLPAEQAEWAIGKALDHDDIKAAEKLLFDLQPGAVRSEECQHVYDYALKNAKLADASNIVDRCWNGDLKKQKYEEIVHESLKQQ